MTLSGFLLSLVVAACVICVPSSFAQANRSVVAVSSGPVQQTIDHLLKRESEALDHFQHVLSPALRCDPADTEFRPTCHGMVTKLQDEAQEARQDIDLYRRSPNPAAADLFDIYVHLQFLLKDIEIFSVADEYNGDGNHQALAEGYNSFVKLTEGWFTGEMKQIISTCAH